MSRQSPEAKAFWDNEVEHFLYRCYDANDVLLYIGCTSDIGSRMAVHASSWGNPVSAYLNFYMTRYEVEGPFVGRLAGRKAEREAIEREAPYLNMHHNKGRGAKRVPIDTSPPTEAELAEMNARADAFFGDLFKGRAS